MKKKKILICLTTLMMTFIIISNISSVLATSGINPSNAQIAPFEKAMKITIGVFEVVTVGVGIIMLIALALKYMAASVGEKAEVKKHAVVYIVGAVIAFGARGILGIIKTFVEEAI